MIRRVFGLLSMLMVLLFLLSCTTPADKSPGADRSPQEETEEKTIVPAQKNTSAIAAEEVPASSEKEQKPSSKDSGNTEENDYRLSEEEKERTKKDLNKLVKTLNEIIARQEYQKWLEYLTEEYKEYYSDKETLSEISNSPVLAKYDVTLRSLKDYFTYVVVASRKNVRIDEIQAIGENTVKAYMDLDDKSVVVYTLKKVDGQWKITISQ